MRKYIYTSLIWFNEAETFGVAKPFDCTCSHVLHLYLLHTAFNQW